MLKTVRGNVYERNTKEKENLFRMYFIKKHYVKKIIQAKARYWETFSFLSDLSGVLKFQNISVIFVLNLKKWSDSFLIQLCSVVMQNHLTILV